LRRRLTAHATQRAAEPVCLSVCLSCHTSASRAPPAARRLEQLNVRRDMLDKRKRRAEKERQKAGLREASKAGQALSPDGRQRLAAVAKQAAQYLDENPRPTEVSLLAMATRERDAALPPNHRDATRPQDAYR
jgi:hypothetical protein